MAQRITAPHTPERRSAPDTYLVECYVPGIERTEVVAAAQRVRDASTLTLKAGSGVEYVATLLMPSDEVVFHLFRSSSADAVRDTCIRAELSFDRVLPSEFMPAPAGDQQ